MSAALGVTTRPARPATRRPLEDLARVVTELELVAAHPFGEFRDGLYVHRAAERLVQLGVDLACEVGLAALLDAGRKAPAGHAETFRDLGKAGLVPAALAEKMAGAAELRRDLLYAAAAEPDEALHRRLPFLAILLREFGRAAEALTESPRGRRA